MKQSNLCHNFAGWSIKHLITSTLIRPFPSKEVMYIAFGIGILFGYEGLERVRDFHIYHVLSVSFLAGEVKKDLKYQYKDSIATIADIPNIR
jgi:hypothetical protein